MRMMGKNSIAILPASPTVVRNRDVHFPYRPDSDFFYLTGFAEPQAVAVMIPGRKHGEYVLFCREKDPDAERWDGRRAGQEGAIAEFGAADSFPITDLDDILPGLLENCERVYYSLGFQPDFDQKLIEWVNGLRARARSGVSAPLEIVALDHLVHDMRLYKSPSEQAVMREAARISAEAHCRAMQVCAPGMPEFQLEAAINQIFQHHGSRSPAYPAIVGGGENGCVLHYIENTAPLRDGDLVLIDAGAELSCYAADITRTFPVNGRFSPAQRALYEVVLEAQLAAIKKVRPGNHWNLPHLAAVRALTRGLVRLGILNGDVNKLIKEEAYKPFYMHRTGHWLGMDVHDVGDYKVGEQWRVLEPGMVLTVEPGLYISSGTKGVAKKWWGIGIRIEDDVLVTKTGNEVLSAGVPKAVDEIEALMAARAA